MKGRPKALTDIGLRLAVVAVMTIMILAWLVHRGYLAEIPNPIAIAAVFVLIMGCGLVIAGTWLELSRWK